MCTCYFIQPETERLKGINNRISRSSLYDKYIRAGSAVLTAGEIKPGNVAPVIAPNRKGEMSVFPMRWGFGSPGSLLLANARLESIRETEVFKDSWKNHRCIVPASWFYEWKQDAKGAWSLAGEVSPEAESFSEEGDSWILHRGNRYEVVASWGNDALQKYGGFGEASYIFGVE